MVESKKIEDLNPILQVIVKRYLEIAKEKGLKVGVSATYRDIEQQNHYYNVTKTTKVKGGYSYHNWGVAVDIVPLNEKGQLYWPVTDNPIWKQMGAIGKSLGLEWGGDWKTFLDVPHYQLTFGYTCTNFVNGTKVPATIKKGCADTNLVKLIQNLLGLKADGIFGDGTEEAVKKYNPSGEIDAAALQKLFSGAGSNAASAPAATPKAEPVKKAEAEKSKLIVDGKEILAETVIMNDYNYVKVRDLLEPMGYAVEFDKGKNAIVANKK